MSAEKCKRMGTGRTKEGGKGHQDKMEGTEEKRKRRRSKLLVRR
jgi:hypothetical protein